MKKRTNSLSFEVVEVPAPEGAVDDLLDFIVDLVIRKRIEKREDEDARSCGLRSSDYSH